MIACVFPGQGAQYPGMGQDLAANFPVAREVFEEASDTLGFDLAALCFSGSEADLQLTANTQPAILTVSVAAWRVLQQEVAISPAFAAGHSLGEYSALVAAGVLTFADAVDLVRQRGSFMQEAVPVGVGAMAAVMGLERALLEKLCLEVAAGQEVAPANYNSPGQIVLAGHAEAVDRAVELAREQGAKRAMRLTVSAPFHSVLMAPAAEQLRESLQPVTVGSFAYPVVSNVEAEAYQDPERVKDLLVRQVCAPVRWEESVQRMAQLGVERYVEIGPGKVLSGLIKRIDRQASLNQVADMADVLKMQH